MVSDSQFHLKLVQSRRTHIKTYKAEIAPIWISITITAHSSSRRRTCWVVSEHFCAMTPRKRHTPRPQTIHQTLCRNFPTPKIIHICRVTRTNESKKIVTFSLVINLCIKYSVIISV